MKSLKTILGICLATVSMGGAVAAGAATFSNGFQPVQRAEAANSDWGYVGSGQGNNWNVESRILFTATGSEDGYHSYKSITFVKDEQFKLFAGNTWQSNSLNGQSSKYGNAASNFSDAGGNDHNIKCNKAGTYDVCVTWSQLDSKNVIGFFESGTLSATVETHYAYIAEKPDDGGYWNPTTIYAFGAKKQFGNWAGKTFTSISDYYSTTTVNLAGEYGNIKKIPFTFADDTFIIHNGSGYQSTNTAFVSNALYYYNGKGTIGDDSGKVLLANSADLGKAAEFICDVEKLREAVPASAKDRIAQYSICGISKSNVDQLVTKYNGLNATQKGYVRSTTVTTYTGSYGSSEGTVQYGKIVDELIYISTGSRPTNSKSNISINNSNTSLFTFVVITASISFTTVLGYLLLKKRKQ